ncbi:unnamed protein product, partial [Mesorhabditis spiculigera]
MAHPLKLPVKIKVEPSGGGLNPQLRKLIDGFGRAPGNVAGEMRAEIKAPAIPVKVIPVQREVKPPSMEPIFKKVKQEPRESSETSGSSGFWVKQEVDEDQPCTSRSHGLPGFIPPRPVTCPATHLVSRGVVERDYSNPEYRKRYHALWYKTWKESFTPEEWAAERRRRKEQSQAWTTREQYEERHRRQSEQHRLKRLHETPEQREARLERNREKNRLLDEDPEKKAKRKEQQAQSYLRRKAQRVQAEAERRAAFGLPPSSDTQDSGSDSRQRTKKRAASIERRSPEPEVDWKALLEKVKVMGYSAKDFPGLFPEEEAAEPQPGTSKM